MRTRHLRTKVTVSAVGAAALIASSLAVAPPAVAARITSTYLATGALQTFQVPAAICAVSITATGGSGGSAPNIPGGVAATVRGRVTVAPGSTLQVVVGQAGGSTVNSGTLSPGGSGGFGGGGGGGVFGGGGGGGASVVAGPLGALVVAGGGGGAVEITFPSPAQGGAGGLLGADAGDGAPSGTYAGGSGGRSNGDGGASPAWSNGIITGSNGGGGGVGVGGASPLGGAGGSGANGFGGGGGAPSTAGDAHAGHGAGPTQTGAGGAGQVVVESLAGSGGRGTAGGGDGADSGNVLLSGGGGGGGGGVGFGGGGGGTPGGGGGGGYGAGGGGVAGGGGGSSWIAPGSIWVGSNLATQLGSGKVTITYDPVADLCSTLLPGSGAVVAPTSGTADLTIPVTLSAPSGATVTASWTTLVVAGAPDSAFGPQAPPGDYVASSGTVTFAPGATTATVHIPVLASSSATGEYVVVSFAAPTNARIGGFYGLSFGIITAAP